MRISKAGLLILITIAIPFIVQIRTVMGFVGVEVTVAQLVVIGVVVIGGIILWAILPSNQDATHPD